jgi:hypothetical protein
VWFVGSAGKNKTPPGTSAGFTLQALEREADRIGLDPFSLLSAYSAALQLATRTSGSPNQGPLAPV